jgi:asparagine synthase (glutamine-hydrolysing)
LAFLEFLKQGSFNNIHVKFFDFIVSGIFGFFNRDGDTLNPETLIAMHTVMAYWGPDGRDTWGDEAIVMGQLLLYNTPESIYERLPRWEPGYGLAFTAEARLDYRDELCDLFEIPHPQRPLTSDGDLILKAYLKWGEDCPHHLLGDWSLAVWRPDERRLFLARDHHGNTSLYYTSDSRFFAFASSKKALLAIPGVSHEINELNLAQVLVSWPPDGEHTVYQSILRLPPAHSLVVTPDKLQKRRYWKLEDAPIIHMKSEQAYIEGFLEVYSQAVRSRLRSYRSLGVTLSGGLDSSSVTVVAARELRTQNLRLNAYTSVPLYEVSDAIVRNRFGDEGPLAHATTEFAGNVDLTAIYAQNVSPIAAIRRMLELHDAPEHAAGNHYWIVDLLHTAQVMGIGSLLTGQGGNATISWSGAKRPPSLSSLLRKHLFRQVLSQILFQSFIPQSWVRRYRILRKEGKWRIPEQPWLDYSAIHPEFASRLDLAKRMAEKGHDPFFIHDSLNLIEDRLAIIKPGRQIGGALWAENGAGYAMEVRDPTIDKRLMEFCLGVPDAIYQDNNGLDRNLIRRAMSGLVPDEVRLNRRRGYQGADLGQRVLDYRPEMEAALDELAACESATHYLDLPRMKAVFQELQTRIDSQTTVQCSSILLRGLMVGLFLVRESQSQSIQSI